MAHPEIERLALESICWAASPHKNELAEDKRSIGQRITDAQRQGPLTDQEEALVSSMVTQAYKRRQERGERTYKDRSRWDMEGAIAWVLLQRPNLIA